MSKAEKHECVYGVGVYYDGELRFFTDSMNVESISIGARFDYCPICGKWLTKGEKDES